MTSPLPAHPERHNESPGTAPLTPLDVGEESWGYECALPYLQVLGDRLESGTEACPRDAGR